MRCHEKLHYPTEMTTMLDLPAFSGRLSPVIAAAAGPRVGWKVYRMGIELSRIPQRDAVPAVSTVFLSNFR